MWLEPEGTRGELKTFLVLYPADEMAGFAGPSPS
jgi:hypothetical protein